MRKLYGKKGSITVFLALLLTMISSFLFALLETARVTGLDTRTELVSDMALESVFAEYQQDVYKNYGVLLLDGAYGSSDFQMQKVEKRLEEMACINLCSSENQTREFYQLEITGCQIPKYQLATDENGDVFRCLAAKTAREEAAVQAVESFADEIQEKESLEAEHGTVEEYLDAAEEAAQKAAEEAAQKAVEEAGQERGGESEQEERETVGENEQKEAETEKNGDTASNLPGNIENPIDEAKKWKKSAVLSMVVQDEAALSNKAISTENCLLHRQKQEGNLHTEGKILDELWFLKYLETHMGTFQNPKSNRVLDYEMEYVLKGKSSDRENLEGAVKSLIAIREISNLAFLAKDAEKQAEAGELAMTLMGWTANPVAISAAKWGILGAWAYTESILDVRALLEGRKISWMKSSEEWTSGIGEMGAFMEGYAMAKDCVHGWDYMEYLQFLLCFEKDNKVNYRSMDLIEANTNVLERETIQMDHMIVTCEARMSYETQPLFWKYVELGDLGLNGFDFGWNGSYTYL